MRIVATSDTHYPIKKRDLIPDGDVLIIAGDMMYTGYMNEWYPRIDSIAELPHKTKIFVCGNHDRHLELYKGTATAEMRERGITVLGEPLHHSTMRLDNGMTVLGLPFVTNLPHWAFNRGEEWLSDWMEQIGRVDIVISHSPPAGILDSDGKNNYGIKAYRRYLKRFQPDYWICGHVHESYGTAEVEGCKFYNSAMCDAAYNQVNKAHIIDL